MSLREAVEQLADERRGAAALPVDVDVIAAGAGLRFEYLDLERSAGGYVAGARVALVNANDHPARQRFTKAHELAHHLYDDDVFAARLRSDDDWHEPHELFAASLLMPRSAVDALRGALVGTPRRRILEAIAERCGVTPIAAAVRLAELEGRGSVPAMYRRLEPAEWALDRGRGRVPLGDRL